MAAIKGVAVDHFKCHPWIHYCLMRQFEKVRQVSETIFKPCRGSVIKHAGVAIDADLTRNSVGFIDLSGGQSNALEPDRFVTRS
jgi:hypothetical protein